jgi:hypothetical protein
MAPEHPVQRTRPDAPVVPKRRPRADSQRTRRRSDARIVGHEGEARTPYADAAVTTRNPYSSGG